MYKLMIVDDEYVEIEALTYIIKNSALPISEIITAGNGRLAIEKAKSHNPDIILMDIKMPGITGIEAASHIKTFNPATKFVFLSAYNYFDYAQEAIRLEANDFLIKPVSNDTLIEVLNRIIINTEKESEKLEVSSSIENQLKLISSYFENELINYLLFADIKKQQLDEYFDALNCSPKYLHTLVVSIDDTSTIGLSSLKATMVKRRCIKSIKEHFYPVSDKSFGNYNKNWLYMVIATDTPIAEDTSVQLLTKIQESLKTNYLIQCRMAISSAVNDTLSLNRSLLSVKHDLLFNNDQSLIVYPKTTYKTSNTFSPKKEQMLLESIQLSNTTMTLAVTSEYFHWLKHSIGDLQTIKYYLFASLSHVIKSLCNTKEALTSHLCSLEYAYVSKLENNSNIDTLFSCFNDQLLNITQIYSQDFEDLESPIIKKLCHYIDQHYNQDLSLKELAANMHMNPQYISKHFKETKGITFSDYLTDVRITKAKSLLTDTTQTIQEIALSIGYNDPNYFTRAFKKHEAITPKNYRLKASASKDSHFI